VLVTLVDISCVCGFLYITRSVSLVVGAFLEECTGVSLYTCVVSLVGLLLFGGLALTVYFITVSTVCLCHEGKILLISWFLSTSVHL